MTTSCWQNLKRHLTELVEADCGEPEYSSSTRKHWQTKGPKQFEQDSLLLCIVVQNTAQSSELCTSAAALALRVAWRQVHDRSFGKEITAVTSLLSRLLSTQHSIATAAPTEVPEHLTQLWEEYRECQSAVDDAASLQPASTAPKGEPVVVCTSRNPVAMAWTTLVASAAATGSAVSYYRIGASFSNCSNRLR